MANPVECHFLSDAEVADLRDPGKTGCGSIDAGGPPWLPGQDRRTSSYGGCSVEDGRGNQDADRLPMEGGHTRPVLNFGDSLEQPAASR